MNWWKKTLSIELVLTLNKGKEILKKTGLNLLSRHMTPKITVRNRASTVQCSIVESRTFPVSRDAINRIMIKI